MFFQVLCKGAIIVQVNEVYLTSKRIASFSHGSKEHPRREAGNGQIDVRSRSHFALGHRTEQIHLARSGRFQCRRRPLDASS